MLVTDTIEILTAKLEALRKEFKAEEKRLGLDILPERLKSKVVGTFSDKIKCDARCQFARGLTCTCSCGTKNHGVGFIEEATKLIPTFYPLWNLLLNTIEDEIEALTPPKKI